MIFDILLVLIGIVLGWFFLPTPTWAKVAVLAIVAKFPVVGKYLKS